MIKTTGHVYLKQIHAPQFNKAFMHTMCCNFCIMGKLILLIINLTGPRQSCNISMQCHPSDLRTLVNQDEARDVHPKAQDGKIIEASLPPPLQFACKPNS